MAGVIVQFVGLTVSYQPRHTDVPYNRQIMEEEEKNHPFNAF